MNEEIKEVNISKKKLVWKDTLNRIVLKSVVVGHFAMWAVRQSPYLLPEELVKGIEEFDKNLISHGKIKIGNKDFIETTCANLQKIVSDVISESTIISSWNVAKKGTGNVFVSRYDEPEPDYDFIALDAMARNIAHSVWLEVCYNDGGFE